MSTLKRFWLTPNVTNNTQLLKNGTEIGCKVANHKSHTGFRLVPNSVILNDLEWHNGRYFTLFCQI